MSRALAFLLLVACDGSDEPDASAGAGGSGPDGGGVSCDVSAPTECPSSMPTYEDIEPILQEHCVGCHWGEPEGPWPLTSYGHAAGWYIEIRSMLISCTMPPPESSPTMTNEERLEILNWIRCGSLAE